MKQIIEPQGDLAFTTIVGWEVSNNGLISKAPNSCFKAYSRAMVHAYSITPRIRKNETRPNY